MWHYADRPLEIGSEVRGCLDWAFRLSNMQNHAWEHIVSGLIHGKYGYDNVGFHMGSEAVTLDINGELTEEQVREIEMEATRAVQELSLIHIFQSRVINGRGAMVWQKK